MQNYNYPGLLKRVKSLVVDSIIILIFMTTISLILGGLESTNHNLRIIAFLFIFILYDPLFISLFGGTIGHKINGICVKRNNNYEKNISFPVAIIRFLVKSFLGWISLLTVTGNNERKAIHDFAASSVVLYINNDYRDSKKAEPLKRATNTLIPKLFLIILFLIIGLFILKNMKNENKIELVIDADLLIELDSMEVNNK